MKRLTRAMTFISFVVCSGCLATGTYDVPPNVKDAAEEKDMKSAFDHNPVCPVGCVTCSAYNGCVTCQRNYFLFLQWHGMRQTGSCVDHCPNGYFGLKKKGHGKCMKCALAHCESCFNRTTCIRCSRPLFLVDGRCVDKCPEHLPYVGPSRQCRSKVDCEVGAWGFWGVCNRKGLTCGYKYGLQSRRRKVLQAPSPNGLQCPVTAQLRKCRLKHRFCQESESNNSELTKIFGLSEVNWRHLERLLIKHRKRKLLRQQTKNSNKKKQEQEKRPQKKKQQQQQKKNKNKNKDSVDAAAAAATAATENGNTTVSSQ